MGNFLFINRVAVNPPKGKTDVTFRGGLNVIRATLISEASEDSKDSQPGIRNSVGKTTFAHMLDYGLGKSLFLNKDKALGRKSLESHDLLMEFRIGDEQFTVQRNLVKGDICILYREWIIDDLLNGVQKNGERFPIKDYRNFMEDKLFSGTNIFEGERFISFRDIMQIIFRDQVGGFESIDKTGNYSSNAEAKRKLQQYLSGLTTAETLNADIQVSNAEEAEKEAKKAFDIIKKYVNHKVNQAEEVIRSEATVVIEQIQVKNEVVADLKQQLILLQQRNDERVEQKQEFLQIKLSLSKEENLVRKRINSFQATLNEVQTEKENIETAHYAHLLLDTYEYEKCPVCLVDITGDPSFKCPRSTSNEEDSDRALETMQTILSNERQDLIQAIAELNHTLEEIQLKAVEIDSEIADLNLEISEDANEILKNIEEKEREQKELTEKLTGLKQDLEYFRDHDDYRRKHGLAKDNLTIAKANRNRIQQQMEDNIESLKNYFQEVVSYLYFGNRIGSFQLSKIAKNFEATIRYLNLSEGRDTGAAAITLAVIAFDLALLKLAINSNTPHPRLLVHDSPNINDIDPSVYNRIFTYVRDELEKPFVENDIEPDFQYIITTILMPDELADDPYVRLELNNNGDKGKLFEFTF
ncbi:DUF2326 domain-containing protein [Paenibacillus physcomitrellae]|uniref:DUF2326 domain-containing protein n=1 Tax=Paenibacillus physcomitrellae TaxID=1619311 RepID=A0ABQ1GT14_9BACL|nr:DUF2326 domain-containing protein [Paenibacillus physcomitrellae]GGA49817.1 hypothetical protein GCM10010917_38890 [Paenibacillus physcomitrellae]